MRLAGGPETGPLPVAPREGRLVDRPSPSDTAAEEPARDFRGVYAIARTAYLMLASNQVTTCD
ncbi:MAG: hypothetical protein JWO18_2618 [Microbacteriaceae bacterium]|jgi:hypothetical protein|nr:hypothetical protein [Microbacteriaceae bacterium]